MERTKMITEGALMLALFTVLLLVSVYVPILSIIGVLFLMLPFFIYSAKYKIAPAFMLLVGAVAITFLIGGPFMMPAALLYGTTGIVMGTMVRRKTDNWIIYMAGSLTFLLNVIAQYVITVWLFDFTFLDEFRAIFETTINEAGPLLGSGDMDQMREQVDIAMSYIDAILPALLIATSFGMVFILMMINYPIAKRLGIQTKPVHSFHTVRLPNSILWYYLLFMISALIANPEEGTMWYAVYVNIMFILQGCLYIQGLSFVFFFAHSKKWSKAIPIIIAILSIPVIPVLYLIRLLGIIDLGFDLRQRMQKKL
ncbi:YybS family protein [Domibacillus mangrovi]|nr:YybS family protein [Domibacillus mangrovi]